MLIWRYTGNMYAKAIEDRVPGMDEWQQKSEGGWLTAGIASICSPTLRCLEKTDPAVRVKRTAGTLKSVRLIGRSLRVVVDLKISRQNTLIDCEVLRADGGTRTASITGAWLV